MKNNSGKALTIFLFIIAVVLVCLTGISAFFFLKEVDMRKSIEMGLQQAELDKAKLEGDLKESEQKLYLWEEKYNDMKKDLEDIQDDLDLAQGVKQKVQEENKSMTASMEKAVSEKEEIEAQLEKAAEEISSLQADLDAAELLNRNLEDQLKATNTSSSQVPSDLELMDLPSDSPAVESLPDLGSDTQAESQDAVDLEKIVVAPGADAKQGKVISVDAETGFLIANLGEKQGIAKGVILSVYRDNQYLGDVQVSRVLPEMSAADFIPPLSGQQVNKDDLVILKQ